MVGWLVYHNTSIQILIYRYNNSKDCNSKEYGLWTYPESILLPDSSQLPYQIQQTVSLMQCGGATLLQH